MFYIINNEDFMKLLLLILFFLNFTIELFAQKDSLNIQLENNCSKLGSFSKGKIITNNYKNITTGELDLYRNYVVFKDLATNNEERIPLEEIIVINALKSSYWLEGAMLGALGGLVIPCYAINSKSSPSGNTFLLASLVGSAIGGIIGYSMDNYDTVYHSGDFFISFQFKNEILLPKIVSNNILLINFQISIN